jgi:hypothetical protein
MLQLVELKQLMPLSGMQGINMSENDSYENCRGRIRLDNIRSDLNETRESMKELWNKYDNILMKVSKLELNLTKSINTRFWGVFLGFVMVIATVVITRIWT